MMVKSGARYEYKNLCCKGCLIIFDSVTRNKKQRFCSKVCAARCIENRGRFKKGVPSWNKDIKGDSSHLYGRKLSNVTRKKIGFANSEWRSVNWKGDKVGYHALHDWVRKYKGKPKLCEHCRKDNRRLEWANKSKEYKRELTDWIPLCVPCHKKYDGYDKKQ